MNKDKYCPACGGKLRDEISEERLLWCSECQDYVLEDDALSVDERNSLRSLWEDEEETV